MNQLYGKMRIEDRFPDEDGALRLQRIFKIYQVGELEDVKWFQEDGSKAIISHPINSRRHTVVDNAYTQSILTRGIVEGVRGEPWLAYSRGQNLPMLAISWGSLSRSFYHAVEIASSNPFVLSALAAGLRGCRRLHERTPEDVIAWLRDYHNQFHGGASYSFAELLTDITEIEEGWVAYKTKNGITARLGAGSSGNSLTYEKLYWQWVQKNHDGKVSSWKQYDSAKSLVHTLMRLRLWDEFMKFCQTQVNYLQHGLSQEAALISLHAISVTITAKFEKILPQQFLRIAILEGVKYALPLIEPPGNVDADTSVWRTEWLFEKPNATSIQKILTSMESSKVYYQTDAPACKRQKKQRSGATPENEEAECVEQMILMVKEQRGERPKVWFEDLLSMIDHALSFHGRSWSALDEEGMGAKALLSLRAVVRVALGFVWTGRCAFKGTVYTAWSVLRKAMQTHLLATMQPAQGVSADSGNPSSVDSIDATLLTAADIRKVAEKQAEKANEDAAKSSEARLASALSSPGAKEKLVAFANMYLRTEMPLLLIPEHAKIVNKVWVSMAAVAQSSGQQSLGSDSAPTEDNVKDSINTVLLQIGSGLFELIGPEVVEMFGLASVVVCKTATIPACMLDILESHETLTAALTKRFLSTSSMLKSLFDLNFGAAIGKGNVATPTISKCLQALEKLKVENETAYNSIAATESTFVRMPDWTQFWSGLLAAGRTGCASALQEYDARLKKEQDDLSMGAKPERNTSATLPTPSVEPPSELKPTLRVLAAEAEAATVVEARVAPAGDAVASGTFMTFKEIFYLHGDTDGETLGATSQQGVALDMVRLVYIQKVIESCLWQQFATHSHWCEKISVDVKLKKPTVMIMGKVPKDLMLPLAGQVDTTKRESGIKVASAFGVDFYVHREGHDNLNNICCIPGWLVHASAPKGKGGKGKGKEVTATLRFDTRSVAISKKEFASGDDAGAEIRFDIACPTIVPVESVVGQEGVSLMVDQGPKQKGFGKGKRDTAAIDEVPTLSAATTIASRLSLVQTSCSAKSNVPKGAKRQHEAEVKHLLS